MKDHTPYYLITGATGAIGHEISLALAGEGKPLILACRNTGRASELKKQLLQIHPALPVKIVRLDLESEQSVRRAADELAEVPLAAIINNAGVMNRRFRTLRNGREATVTVNFLHTKLLTELLLPYVVRGGAVTFTTSLTRHLVRKHKYSMNVTPENFSQLGTYALSKRAITDYAFTLAIRLHDRKIRVNCADPGVVDTGMICMDRWFDSLADKVFRPFIRSPRKGARPMLRALASDLSGYIFGMWTKSHINSNELLN